MSDTFRKHSEPDWYVQRVLDAEEAGQRDPECDTIYEHTKGTMPAWEPSHNAIPGIASRRMTRAERLEIERLEREENEQAGLTSRYLV